MNKRIIVLFFCSLILAVLILLPYSVNISHGVPNVIDPLFYAWNLSYNADNMFKGMGPAVNTNIFYPLTNTIAYSDTLWGQSIIINPVIWLTHNPILAENLLIILSFPLSAICMYALAFYLSQNPVASFISGIFYAFSYPRLSQIGHLPTIMSQWLPLYILYVLKFLKNGNRKDVILACALYLLAIASSIYFGVFLIPITALIVIIDTVRKIYRKNLSEYIQRIISILPVVIPFLVLLTIVLFPYLRLKVEHPELKRTIEDLRYLRAALNDYISVLPTSLLAFLSFPQKINEHVLYPTLTILMLAIIGVVTAIKRNKYHIGVFVLIISVSFILSLGDEQSLSIGSFSTGTVRMPYYYLYSHFPIFQIIRVPARFGIFIVLSLSALAALGIDTITKKIQIKSVLLLCLIPFLLEVWQIKTPSVSVPLENSIPAVYKWIRRQPEPVIIAELPLSVFYHGIVMEDQLYTPYAALRQPDTYALETYRTYFSAYHKKRMINGYSGYLTDSYNKLAANLEGFPSDNSIQTLQHLGVTNIIVHLWQYDVKKQDEIRAALSESRLVTPVYFENNDVLYIINNN